MATYIQHTAIALHLLHEQQAYVLEIHDKSLQFSPPLGVIIMEQCPSIWVLMPSPTHIALYGVFPVCSIAATARKSLPNILVLFAWNP